MVLGKPPPEKSPQALNLTNPNPSRVVFYGFFVFLTPVCMSKKFLEGYQKRSDLYRSY